jgi:DNA-binding GntR family transcriptional regulator
MRAPLWSRIEDVYGERMAEVEQSIRVRPTPLEIAARLQVESASSVVEVRRTCKTTSGKIAEVGANLYPAANFRFNMTMRRA